MKIYCYLLGLFGANETSRFVAKWLHVQVGRFQGRLHMLVVPSLQSILKLRMLTLVHTATSSAF